MDSDQKLANMDLMHGDHRRWLSQLNFYQDEIKFFQNELAEVINKHNDSLSMIESVEEYKAILLRKLARIDDLRHLITAHEARMAASPLDMQLEEFEKHRNTSEALKKFVQGFEMLKKNFKRFAAHND